MALPKKGLKSRTLVTGWPRRTLDCVHLEAVLRCRPPGRTSPLERVGRRAAEGPLPPGADALRQANIHQEGEPGMAQTIIKLDIGKEIMSTAKPKIFTLGASFFQIDYPTDKNIQKALKSDPLLQSQMFDVAKGEYTKLLRQMCNMVKGYEKQLEESIRDPKACDAILKKFTSIYQEQINTNTHFAKQSVEKVWTDFAKRDKQYSKYKWKEGAKIGIAVAGLSASIASMAASAASFGATAIVSIAGIAKSSVALGKQIGELCLEVEDKQRELNRILKTVQARYEKMGGKSMLKEAGANLVNNLFELELANLSTAKKCGEAVDNKLAGVETKGHDFAKKLNEILKKSEKLHGELQPKEVKKLEKLEADVHALIGKVIQNVKRVKKAQKQFANSAKVLEALVKKQPKALDFFDKAMVLTNFLLVTGWEDVVQSAGELAAGYAVDKIIDRV